MSDYERHTNAVAVQVEKQMAILREITLRPSGKWDLIKRLKPVKSVADQLQAKKNKRDE